MAFKAGYEVGPSSCLEYHFFETLRPLTARSFPRLRLHSARLHLAMLRALVKYSLY